jgi:hypothetical protein
MKHLVRDALPPEIVSAPRLRRRSYCMLKAVLGFTCLIASPMHRAFAQTFSEAGASEIARGDYVGAIRILNPLVARADPTAERMLGGLYLAGLGVAKDCEKGERLVKAAANANDVRAEFVLGQIYVTGTCGKSDIPSALAWFEKAADAGDPDAAFSVGLILSRNEGVRPDLGRAYYWFVVAAREFETLASEHGLPRDHPSLKNMGAAERRSYDLENTMAPEDRRRATTLLTAGSRSSFALLCSGVTSTVWNSGVRREENFAETFRIDPLTGLYCRGECKVVVPLTGIDRRSVVISDQPGGPTADGRNDERIDLPTDAYSKRVKSSFFEANSSGHCVRQKFEGFPQRLAALPQ